MADEVEEVEEPRWLPDTQYAYLCITGVGSSQVITDTVGIKPTKEWSEGDPWVRGGTETKRFFMHWSLESNLEHQEDLNAHIRAIIHRLKARRAEVQSLLGRYDVKMTCVSYDRQAFSFELDFALQRELTDSGIRLWFDAYVASDTHTLVQDLRRQISDRE